jgi:FkbM family methyltransferase
MKRLIFKLKHYYSALGFRGVIAFCLAKLQRRKPLYRTSVVGIRTPVWVRLGTTDASVLKQVLLERHYEFPLNIPVRTIIDAGANIGLSAVYFANRFPHAKIIAVEPDAANFELLTLNISGYTNIRAIKAAIWSEHSTVALSDPGEGSHGIRTQPMSANSVHLVDSLTIDDLIRMEGWDCVDLLKVDIEGAEKVVFSKPNEWISRVNSVMIEFHERISPGCEAAVLDACHEFAKQATIGESTLLVRESTSKSESV